ncbi:MAG TPA: hypothetical protein VL749_00010 [Patescibacteria group bacterium]|nr:hypothetical protein [Patescibacteria group bacterium]
MTEIKPAPTTAEGLGVVDPMRVPGAAAARRAFLGLPTIARVFVALVGLDILIRAVGLFGTELFLSLDNPLSWFSAFFPHDALILLPALVVARRPDAVDSIPMVVRGAFAVALVELLATPARGIVSGNALEPIVAPTIVSIVAILFVAGGWYWLALGLRALNPARPAESSAGLANLVGGALALTALINLAGTLFGPVADLGDPIWTALLQLNSAMFVVQSLAFAYLARIAVLGTGDPGRPTAATNLATGSLVLLAIGAIVLAIGPLLIPVTGQNAIWVVLGWLTGPVALTAFVASFGLGLADPSGTIEPAVQTERPVLA